jgi:hypothetical protein
MADPAERRATKCFVNVLNNQSSSVTDGEAVVWNISSPDGVRTTQPVSATLNLLVGLADGTIAASAYGLAQAYGYKASASVSSNATTAIAAGDVLVPVNAADYLAWSATGTALAAGVVYAAEAVVTDSTPVPGATKVFIRALTIAAMALMPALAVLA